MAGEAIGVTDGTNWRERAELAAAAAAYIGMDVWPG
jgi:hypothetical protein